MYWKPIPFPHSLTHSLTHSLINSLTHLLDDGESVVDSCPVQRGDVLLVAAIHIGTFTLHKLLQC